MDLSSMVDLAPYVSNPSKQRHLGRLDVTPVLVIAAPGTGKSWASQQLVWEIARRSIYGHAIRGV